MTPRRSLSSNAKPTCVRRADTSHGGWYSNASKCRSPTCRSYLYPSTNFGTGALRPPERGQKLSRSCAADRSTSKKEQQQRRLRAGQMRSRRQGLQELGWTDGRNIQIETRFGAADAGRIRAHAAELV